MYASYKKYTGTQYTLTAMLLLIAFVFTPVVLMLTRPFGYLSVSLAILFSAGSAGMAWLSWRRFSQLTIPSLGTPFPRSR